MSKCKFISDEEWDETYHSVRSEVEEGGRSGTMPTPRTLSAASTTIDYKIGLENLPSPPKIPPSRSTAVINRVNQFTQWSEISKVLATDSYLEDCGSSPMRRSALRDVSQCATNKSVTFREEENNYIDQSPHSSLSSNRYSPMKRPPPPYEQLKHYIRHAKNNNTFSVTNNDNMVVVGNSTQDIFYDAQTSFSQGKRKVTFKERRNR